MPSAIRMLVTDLDGTLLDSGGQIAPRTRLAIEAIRRRNVAVTLATARRFVGALPVARELDGQLNLVLYDGAQVRDFPSERILMQRTLDREHGQLAAQIIAEVGL